MKKLILFGLVFLVLLSSAFAVIDDPIFYVSHDDANVTGSTSEEWVSGNNGTISDVGTMAGITGIEGEAFDFDGSNDKVTHGEEGEGSNTLTVCTFVNYDTLGWQSLIVNGNRASDRSWEFVLGADKLHYAYSTTVAGAWQVQIDSVSTSLFSTGTWYHVCVTHSGTNINLYVDGTEISTTSSGTNSTSTIRDPTNNFLTLGNDQGSFWGDVKLDNVVIYDRALNSTEINDLYSQNGVPFAPSTTPYFNIISKDEATAITLTNITVTLDNGTTYVNETGTTITTPFNDSSLQNFTVSVPNYFNKSFINYNTSVNLQANLTGFPLEDFSLITPNNSLTTADSYIINWTEALSPTGKVVNYNVSILFTDNLSRLESFSTTNLYYTLNITSYNSNNYTIVVNATESGTNGTFEHNSTLSVDKPNYLYFFNEQTSEVIYGANITIQFPNATNLEIVTDSEGKVNFSSFQNNVLQTGNYSITFEDFIGFVTPITFQRSYNTLPINETFNITVTNINVSIFFRNTFAPFTNNATVIIEGVDNYTTSNGTIFIQNATISNGEYRLTVSSDGYFNEETTFTYNGQQALGVNIYMLELNNSNSGTVTVRTVDDFSKLLEGSQVNLLEYDTSTLSYIEVSECYTDSNGECKFIVETNTKSYKLTASRIVSGNTITASTGAQIFEDDISGGEIVLFSEETITLTLSSQELFAISEVQNIIYNITESFNETSNQSNIDVSFRTIDGTNIQVCVEYFELTGGLKISKTGSTFCVTGASGEVTENAYFTLNRSKEYVAEVYIKQSGANILLDSFRYVSVGSFIERLESNATLPYFALFIWIIIIGFGIMLKNVPFVGVSIIVGAWVTLYFMPSIFFTSLAVLQTILGITLIYNGRKKEDFV